MFNRIKRILGYLIHPLLDYFKDEKLRKRVRYTKYFIKLKIKENTVMYESFYGRGMVCNPYAMFREMLRDDYYKNYTHIWVLENLSENQVLINEYKKNPNVKFVEYQSNQYLKALAASKIVINNNTFPDYFVKKENQIFINTWHGIPLKYLGFSRPDGAIIAKRQMRSFLQTDYMISANSFLTKVYQESYKINEIYNGKILEEGYPRNDLIFSDRDYVIQKLAHHGVKIDINKKIILYAPTWRGATFSTIRNTVEDMLFFREQVLDKIDKNKYQVLLKPHQLLGKMFKEIGATDFIVPSTFDANEALSVTDILISDFSSIYFDFLTTKRPVIFYITDEEEYKEERGIYFGLDELPAEYTDEISRVCEWINSIDEFYNNNRKQYNKVRDFCENTDKQNISKQVLDIVIKGDETNKKITNSTEKEKILFLKGTPTLNGPGTATHSLLNNIDYSKYDVTFYIYESKTKEQRNYILGINPNVRVLIRISTFSSTLLERVKLKLTNEYCYTFKFIQKLFPKDAYQREIKRCLGNTNFDYVIDIDGATRLVALLGLQVPGKKHFIWQHYDMFEENKTNLAWLHHIFSLYKYYDKVVSTSNILMEINKRKLSNFSIPESKFTSVTNFVDIEKIELQSNTAKYAQINEIPCYIDETTTEKHCYIPLISNNEINQQRNLIIDIKNHNNQTISNQIIVPTKTNNYGMNIFEISDITKENLEVKTKFITVGRAYPEKNYRTLINAFSILIKEYPNILLYIVGDGKHFAKESNYIKKYKLQNNIIMIKNIKNPIGLMQKCDCYIRPSIHEGNSMSVLEAQAIKMPIILTNFDTINLDLFQNYISIETDKDAIYQSMKTFIKDGISCNYNFDPSSHNNNSKKQLNNLL